MLFKLGFRSVALAAITLACALLCSSGILNTGEERNGLPQVMIVGVLHLQAHQDLHNVDLGDPLSPVRQKQIAQVAQRLLAFHPTKVMIEAQEENGKFEQRYRDYLRGAYTLGPNENDQFGLRLARLAGNKSIFPIDVPYPFDYEKLQAYAKAHDEQSILDRADAANFGNLLKQVNARTRSGTILDLLRFINTPKALDENIGWYLAIDRIGSANDFAGSDLCSQWWTRNLRIFSNIARQVDANDRAIVFIGQGHAAILRNFVRQSPEMQFVDPEDFLK